MAGCQRRHCYTQGEAICGHAGRTADDHDTGHERDAERDHDAERNGCCAPQPGRLDLHANDNDSAQVHDNDHARNDHAPNDHALNDHARTSIGLGRHLPCR